MRLAQRADVIDICMLLGADSKISTLNKIRRALGVAGVKFIDQDLKADRGPGVRLRHGAKGAGKRK